MKQLKEWTAFFIIFLCNLLPVKRNKIMMFSYYGSNYGCNPKYITDYMTEHAAGKFDIVWAFTDPASKADLTNIRKVKIMSLKYFYELCTSKVIITNYRMTKFFIKRRKQYYIQTWHSSLRLKQIEQDAIDVLPPEYIKMAKKDASKCDLLLSGCKYSTDIFRRSFWYDGEIFENGTPRNDLFLQHDDIKSRRILEALNISAEKKILLYAPTFRKSKQQAVFDLDVESLTETLKNKFDESWVVLVKLHPHLLAESKGLLPETVHDVTGYDDIQELLFVSDMLITDYSSLMFDFAMTQRPCLLYVPDVSEYTKEDRKLYFKLEALPFISAESNEELLDKINNYTSDVYLQNLSAFLADVGSYETGHACEELIHRIEEVCDLKKGSELGETV